MQIKDSNTEQAILEAAEKEFLDKGYARTKTTEIAKRAGVNHAMLHYYFRTKENLFDMVFQQKTQVLATSISATFNNEMSFFDRLRTLTETHFDFLVDNPKILFFIYSEVVNDEKRKAELVKIVSPKLELIIEKMTIAIDGELKKGTIRPITPFELLLNIISLNIMTFLAIPLLGVFDSEFPLEAKNMLKDRRESNVQFITNALKI